MITGLESHPALAAFPLMTGSAFDAFKADVKNNGVLEPVVWWRVKPGHELLLDGRNRERACHELGFDRPVRRYYEGDDPLMFVIALNLHRRMLNESQRAIVAARLSMMPRGRPSKIRRSADLSGKQAAHLLNVGERTIERARSVLSKGAPELVAAVEQGTTSVEAAAELARRGRREQRAELATNVRPVSRAENRARSAMSQAIRLTESDLFALDALAELGDEAREPRARAGVQVLRRIVPALQGRSS